MARFEREFIEELNSKIDLVDIVSRYCTLNRKGDRYWGCCPFHSEKTPSFSVQQDKQFYYCFGCSKGGGTINFMMDIEHLDFPEAVTRLAEMCGMPLPENSDRGIGDFKKRIYTMNSIAAKYFYGNLSQPCGAQAIAYLKKRGVSPETVKKFGMGYAPAGWNNLSGYLRKQGYTDSEMIQAGLVRSGEKGVYDCFRDRLMFPIIDAHGNVAAFGGRIISGDEKTAKYLNTNDTPVYSKKTILYGYNLAKKSGAKKFILVEGYMDCVSLHQAGFPNTVASLGTALTKEHAKLLGRTVSEVVVAYDTDRAGTIATGRAIEIFAQNGINLRILRVPGGKDPDEFIRTYGPEEFQKVLDGAEQQMDYRLRAAKSNIDLKTDEGKVDYLKAASAVLATVNNQMELEVYAGRVAQEADVSREAVIAEATRQRKQMRDEAHKKAHAVDINPERLVQPLGESGVRYANPKSAIIEEQLISLLCSYPALKSKAAACVQKEWFSSPELGRIFGAITGDDVGEYPDVGMLSGVLMPEDMRLLSKIMAAQKPHKGSERELNDICEKLRPIATEGEDPLLALINKKKNNG